VQARVGQYEIERCLGEGAMGVVYAARDPRLDRTVAIKMIRAAGADAVARERLWREARAAACVNHPNICQVYDIGEHQGDLYIAMELLEGVSLVSRLERGALPLGEAVAVALGMLCALEALHARGIVHRDLKPSNVFLTAHGVKLLDFGLARSLAEARAEDRLTLPGTAVGTPRYMAPEIWSGEAAGPPSDVFAVGAVLFEMLTGQAAFAGRTVAEVCRAVLHEPPPAIAGDGAAAAADRIVRRALAKPVRERYPDAATMATDLRAVLQGESAGQTLDRVAAVPARSPRRLLVLPFRMLRPDAEIEFLAYSLPDAITSSLSGLESLVVRSSAVAERFAGATPDLARIAAEAAVEAVVYGTLLRAGEQVRVATQLVEAPSGVLLSSRTSQVRLQDIFALQDQLAHEIVTSLAVPLSAGDQARLRQGAPAGAHAYELYLRANNLADNHRVLPDARDLYLACLAEDPAYAPAWARLGRVYRIMAKYVHDGDARENLRAADEAFQKALALDPDLAIAHNLYTYFELEELGRSIPSLVRLLERVRTRSGDADLFAALVLACRFCDLLPASLAADRRARRLDPGARTSVQYTYWMLGEWDKAMLYDDEHSRFVSMYALPMAGRTDEALARYRSLEASHQPGLQHTIAVGGRAALEQNREECTAAAREILRSGFHDPEGRMFVARWLAWVGERELALETLAAVVDGGLYCATVLDHDPWLAPVRDDARFAALRDRALAGRRRAADAYLKAGGVELLGVQPLPAG
jgi:serine/threonine protein kinase/tetratricopeptide (TPR) repeat protein